MENFIFLYIQKGVEKSLQIKLPIGCEITKEQWSGLFDGFDAELLAVAKYSDVVDRWSR